MSLVFLDTRGTSMSFATPIAAWLHALSASEATFKHSARSVALALLQLSDEETACTAPVSYKEVAQLAGCNRKTLIYALQDLETAGLIRRVGAHEQRNAYFLVVDHSLVRVTEPGPFFGPGECDPTDFATEVGGESTPTPVADSDHECSLTSLSSLLSKEVDDQEKTSSTPVPLPRNWQPNSQNLQAMISKGMDQEQVLADFFDKYADPHKPTTRSDWDSTFGWWVNKGGWDKYRAQLQAQQLENQRRLEMERQRELDEQRRREALVRVEDDTDINDQTAQQDFRPTSDLVLRTQTREDRAFTLAVTTLGDEGLSGASVRDQVRKLADVGLGYLEIVRTIRRQSTSVPELSVA
ncbi:MULTISPECIES: helix-turn-helix domain-containing protein [Rhodococcus]|uniref:helix-turn-helix domain-containing protein n=2 Tax=Rhodococcus TaxID=1827 RepID=UPI0002F2AFEC|nr:MULTISPECIES: helix-turn-helix domain-containing protein [Rhodococcus]